MKDLLRKSTVNQRLALIAFVMGCFALAAGDPYRGRIATIDAKEMALIVHNKVDRISPAELADWIIAGKADYRLVDIRTPEEFAVYHIPGAENVPLPELADGEYMRNEKIVLCSDGGIHAAQAWFLMKAQGFKSVSMLFGGLEGWKDEVLFPTLAVDATDMERINFAKVREVSAYFGGTPRTGEAGEKDEQAFVVPKLDMPVQVAPQTAGAKKKKKEGC